MDKLAILKKLYKIEASLFKKIQDDIILEHASRLRQVKNPKVIILGAQPGAGKTEMEKEARLELNENVVVCNGDTWRDYHPDANLIKAKHEALYPELTVEAAHAWNKGLRDYCEANRLNYILETTFSSGEAMNQTIAELRQKGYRVNIKLLAIPPKLSLLGTYLRFEKMKAEGGSGRQVPKEIHDQKFSMIQPTLNSVQLENLYNNLQIYNRNILLDQDDFTSGVRVVAINPGNALQVYQREINRRWPEKLEIFFAEKVQLVSDLMQNRNASESEINIFMEYMFRPYQLTGEEIIREQDNPEELNLNIHPADAEREQNGDNDEEERSRGFSR
jgi:predicted ABC-type ATPase